jgi:ferredoxin
VRVKVNYDICMSNGVCMRIAPQVFQVRADGYMYILDDTPVGDSRARAVSAVNACPVEALTLEDAGPDDRVRRKSDTRHAVTVRHVATTPRDDPLLSPYFWSWQNEAPVLSSTGDARANPSHRLNSSDNGWRGSASTTS